MIAQLVYHLRPAITTCLTTEGFSTLTLDTSALAAHPQHSIRCPKYTTQTSIVFYNILAAPQKFYISFIHSTVNFYRSWKEAEEIESCVFTGGSKKPSWLWVRHVYTCKSRSKVVVGTSNIFAYIVQILIICLTQNSELNYALLRSTL